MDSSFSWKSGISPFVTRLRDHTTSPLSFINPDLPKLTAYEQVPKLPIFGKPSLLRPHFSYNCKSRNINLVPIDYASPPRLRGRLTLLRLASCRKP